MGDDAVVLIQQYNKKTVKLCYSLYELACQTLHLFTDICWSQPLYFPEADSFHDLHHNIAC